MSFTRESLELGPGKIYFVPWRTPEKLEFSYHWSVSTMLKSPGEVRQFHIQ